MRKTYALIYSLLCCILLNAQYVEINGVGFQLSNLGDLSHLEAKVVKRTAYSTKKYAGNIVIPEFIEYEGKTYTVCSIDSAFENCSNLISILLPKSVKYISPYSFYGCEKMTSIHLPDSLIDIGYSAFAGCIGLKSVEFPENLKHVRDKAFSGCNNLSAVFIHSPFLGSTASTFDGCTHLSDVVCFCDPKHILFPIALESKCVLHLPSEYLNIAKKSLMGSCFERILEFDDYNLGVVYLNCRKFDLSENYLQKARDEYYRMYNEDPVKNSHRMARVHNSLTYLYFYKGEYSKALEEIDKAISYSPNNANLYDSKGEVILMKGDIDAALKIWEKILELNPDFASEMGDVSVFYQQLKTKGMIKE